MNEDPWRVEVTDADIRAAKRAWIATRDSDATDAEVDRHYDDLRRLVSAQAQQIADVVRARAAARRKAQAD
ncbi:hypothetical protein [Cellulomonas sp.]|uniref:hypothetical protein n=1 Tax=Cellulomonas sp. TaxID=40001 RepID=UPI002D63289E|nr:hypothetical protein [Cellulomonas sp.]HYQ76535.1 hypothetical protein [Cellulomonas sp.]